MKIIELTQHESTRLQQDLVRMTADGAEWRTLKVSVDGAGFKYKCGEGMWSPSLGHDLNSNASDLTALRRVIARIEAAENEADQRMSDLNLAAEKSCDYTHHDEMRADENEASAERLGVLLRAIHEYID